MSLKKAKEEIINNLIHFMSNLDSQILQCEEDISATTEKKLIAQAQGDLSENMEYQAALEKLGQLNVSMVTLTNRRDAWREFSAVRNQNAAEYVGEGSCILLEDKYGNTYKVLVVPALLGRAELNAISTESPVGKAALGKIKGDVLEVITPSGERRYTIVDIH